MRIQTSCAVLISFASSARSQLKLTSKQLDRLSKKCEKDAKDEKTKIKKALEKDNQDGERLPPADACARVVVPPSQHTLSARRPFPAQVPASTRRMRSATRATRKTTCGSPHASTPSPPGWRRR